MLTVLPAGNGGEMKTRLATQLWISRLLALVLLLGPGLSVAEVASQHCHETVSSVVTVSVVADASDADMEDCCCEQGLPCDMDASCVSVCSLLAVHAGLLSRPWQVAVPMHGRLFILSSAHLPPPFPVSLERPPRIHTA